jgi:hypothetical protein
MLKMDKAEHDVMHILSDFWSFLKENTKLKLLPHSQWKVQEDDMN